MPARGRMGRGFPPGRRFPGSPLISGCITGFGKHGSEGREHMEIIKEVQGNHLTLKLAGRLDTGTAPGLEAVLKDSAEGVAELVFDMEKLEYISSAGLRVLLSAQKMMNRQGSMRLRHVGEAVRDVLEITGFVDILTIENE